ncbi:response regulator [Occallatibacter riparius]|uniref:Response regulator n=1 Tax=Occallatibacter riparius TaxID=1002689 RepID=A0A9J7BVY3_9BACT|nr:response regulator [Occallatibacter riparius]UWZ85954.1 response regulator [Occallatibacter riparius]
MTTESTQPQPDAGQSQANGQGQSQGHRRRRRRRKNKSSHSGAPQMQQGQQPQQQPAQQPQASAPKPPQQQMQQRPQGQQGRKKKKFFQKGSGGGGSQPQASPGNSIHAPQGKRKNKQRGPREFVGPMDHSYRAVNGNVADMAGSTIPTPGNGNFYSDIHVSQGPAAPVRHDAPTRIFCFIEDLFFLAKINETARKLGVKVEFVKGADKDTVARILEAPETERARLIVFDLNNANAKPMTLIPKFKTKFKRATSVVGFLSHLQGDLKAKAVEVGCDTVMPRSAFSQSLPNLLRRYGMEEEEEYVPQPA